MPQSTLTTSSPSSLKNNLQPPYKLLFFFSLLSAQPQSWIWTLYIKTSYQLSLVTQLLQNTSLQMAGGLQTQMVYSFLTTEFMYHLLVTSTHTFSSTIMITFLPDILVKTKHQNQSAMDTPGPASVLMYNNSASPVSLVCHLNHNITSPINLSNNFPSLNDHGDTILVIVDQLTKQVIFIPAYNTIMSMDLAHLFVLHVFSKYSIPSHVTSNRGSEFMLNFF